MTDVGRYGIDLEIDRIHAHVEVTDVVDLRKTQPQRLAFVRLEERGQTRGKRRVRGGVRVRSQQCEQHIGGHDANGLADVVMTSTRVC